MEGIIESPPMDRRLQKRYWNMVRSHMRVAPRLAAGVTGVPGATSALAATQGAWRFLNNERVTLPALVEPLREVGRRGAAAAREPFVLLVHDWCKLTYDQPKRKRDQIPVTHAHDVGYDLTTALLVSADDGTPWAPMELHLRTAAGLLSTRDRVPADESHLAQVGTTMAASRTWGLARPVRPVIDREADSVGHFRRWHAAEERFLVRADDRRVTWQERSVLVSEIAANLRDQRVFREAGAARFHGRKARLFVAETSVVLDRPAKTRVGDRQIECPGPPLPLRLIVAQVRHTDGTILTQWFLLSNAPADWGASDKLARCYYWRWRIESYFKLLKGHGQQVEQWEQETGAATARRLLVAAMACVTVWQLQHTSTPEATELKDLLIRLSGRQTKRSRPHTAPALLAGLWTLLSMLAALDHDTLDQLKSLATQIPFLNSA